MSQPTSFSSFSASLGAASGASAGGDVRASIARAAQATGVDFNYLLAQARLESSLDPTARAATSSAAGLYQFTGGTWLATLDRHGAQHGLGWADAAISDGRVQDPAMRAQIMALRHDPDAAALMAAELANDNRMALTATLGREPDATELYMAHFLGHEGASRFLNGLASDPGQSAAALLPRAAAANRGIFYDSAGAPRSVGGMMELMRGKIAGAMGAEAISGPRIPYDTNWAFDSGRVDAVAMQAPPTGGPLAREFQSMGTAAMPPVARTSMADTLRDTFGLGHDGGGGSGGTDSVRAAYGRLKAMGL